ncbi:hypothetical protein L914_08704 [Phytophthora nicotianae]|nr:hypothetical protein L914_08704 [Phytophthora nicotianae]
MSRGGDSEDETGLLQMNDLPPTTFMERLSIGGEETAFSGVSSQIVDIVAKRIEKRELQYLVLTAAPKREAFGVIRRCRDASTGGDAFRAIETEKVRRISDDDDREFLQMNLAYPMEGKLRRIVGFGHPDLIRLMKYPGITLFVDTTVSVTPKPFTQTIIVMIHDRAHNLYVPCFCYLVDTKDHWTYWNVSQWIKIQTDMACVPSMGLGDFEQALHLEIRDQFESACIVGYLFYWKQAIRRKMISLGIARVEVAAAMESGVLDLFTVLPVNVLQKTGIPFVIKTLYRLIVPTEADRKEKWQAFWDYFVKTW